MNEKQKKAVGLGAVALAALAIFSSQTADEPLPQGFSGGFPTTGTLGGGGVAREEPSLAEQLQKFFQPPPTPYIPETDRTPALAKRDETLVETVKRIGSSPVPPEAIEFGGQKQVEQLTGYQEGIAPSPSWFERLRGYDIGFKPAPSGSITPKRVGTYTSTPKPVSYSGKLESPGVRFGGSVIGGIGQSSIPTKYRSGSSSSRKSSTPSHGPIRYDTPKTAPKNLDGVISTPKSSSRKSKGGLTIRKTTAAERAKSESQRKKRLKIR